MRRGLRSMVNISACLLPPSSSPYAYACNSLPIMESPHRVTATSRPKSNVAAHNNKDNSPPKHNHKKSRQMEIFLRKFMHIDLPIVSSVAGIVSISLRQWQVQDTTRHIDNL
ncbi:hypothetical protein BDR04DRAFT_253389 [Suillus decipiens]|nr:hypothetical protein BDR04DRAFT_253389 [Suillus decipiens]